MRRLALSQIRLIRSGLGDAPVIIALTANSLPGDRERCIQAGMNDYLAKPFQRSDLVRLLDRYLPIVESADTDAEARDHNYTATANR